MLPHLLGVPPSLHPYLPTTLASRLLLPVPQHRKCVHPRLPQCSPPPPPPLCSPFWGSPACNMSPRLIHCHLTVHMSPSTSLYPRPHCLRVPPPTTSLSLPPPHYPHVPQCSSWLPSVMQTASVFLLLVTLVSSCLHLIQCPSSCSVSPDYSVLPHTLRIVPPSPGCLCPLLYLRHRPCRASEWLHTQWSQLHPGHTSSSGSSILHLG